MTVRNKDGNKVPYQYDVETGLWFNTETLIYISDEKADELGLHDKFDLDDLKNMGTTIFVVAGFIAWLSLIYQIYMLMR